MHTGTGIVVDGILVLPPAGDRQKVELHANEVLHVGPVEPAKYPLPKMRQIPLEVLRDFFPEPIRLISHPFLGRR